VDTRKAWILDENIHLAADRSLFVARVILGAKAPFAGRAGPFLHHADKFFAATKLLLWRVGHGPLDDLFSSLPQRRI
jgi:hypothetical protein